MSNGLISHPDCKHRCWWSSTDPVYVAYHDTEWGVPEYDSRALFEKLILDGFQAGLSWITILRRRPAFREVFHGFDVDKVAAMTDEELEVLMSDTGIVRNRAKILATRRNAQAAVGLRDDAGLEAFIDAFRPERDPEPATSADVPTTSPESVALSKALRKRGFGFVGPTTVHALMEATGLVDTHLVDCHRRGVAR